MPAYIEYFFNDILKDLKDLKDIKNGTSIKKKDDILCKLNEKDIFLIEINIYLKNSIEKYLGIEKNNNFHIDGWIFRSEFDVTELIEPEISIEEALEQVKQLNSLTTKKTMTKTAKTTAKKNPVAEKFVFMDKTVSILNVGFSTAKNVILYGPGE